MAFQSPIPTREEVVEGFGGCFHRLCLYAFRLHILEEEVDASYVNLFLYEIMRLKRKALHYLNTVSSNREEDLAYINSGFAELVDSYQTDYGNVDTASFVYRIPDNVAEPLV